MRLDDNDMPPAYEEPDSLEEWEKNPGYDTFTVSEFCRLVKDGVITNDDGCGDLIYYEDDIVNSEGLSATSLAAIGSFMKELAIEDLSINWYSK